MVRYALSGGLFLLFLTNFCFEIWPVVTALETTDFPNYYLAGKRLLAGQPIYAPIRETLINDFNFSDYKAYTADTPLAVIILSPLSLLEMSIAAHVLNIISILLLITSVYILCKRMAIERSSAVLLLALCLSSVPFLFLLKRVHMESILLFVMSLGLIALLEGRHKKAGVLWGFCAALKLFPLMLLVPYLLWNKKREVAIFGFVTFLLLTSISMILVGADNSRSFILEVIPRSREWYGSVGNYSLASFFAALSQDNFWLPSITAILLIVIFYGRELGTKFKSTNDARAFCLSLPAALLISPLSWINYLVLLVPIVVIILKRVQSGDINRTYLLPLFISFWRWPDYIETPYYSLTVTLSSLPMFGLLFLMFYYQRNVSGFKVIGPP